MGSISLQGSSWVISRRTVNQSKSIKSVNQSYFTKYCQKTHSCILIRQQNSGICIGQKKVMDVEVPTRVVHLAVNLPCLNTWNRIHDLCSWTVSKCYIEYGHCCCLLSLVSMECFPRTSVLLQRISEYMEVKFMYVEFVVHFMSRKCCYCIIYSLFKNSARQWPFSMYINLSVADLRIHGSRIGFPYTLK